MSNAIRQNVLFLPKRVLHLCMVSIEQLNALRKLKKVPMSALEKPLSLSRQQVSNLFSGKTHMKLHQFITICLEMGVNTEFCYLENK